MSSGVPDLTLAIMAGGKSSRMGSNKSFVQLQGKPIIEHVLSRVSEIQPQETIIITNHPAEYAHLGLPMFGDVLPEKDNLLVIDQSMDIEAPESLKMLEKTLTGLFNPEQAKSQRRQDLRGSID
jgi:hypothetical protein